jgi:hypothetical protein
MVIPVEEHIEQDSGDLLVGVGSTTNTSLSRHKMSQTAIEQMKQQAVGLPGFLNHDPDQVFGQIVDVKESGPDEYVPVFKMLSDHENPNVVEARDKVNHWLANGMQIGLSMGGVIQEAKVVEKYDDQGNLLDYYLDIQSIKLLETSVTPIPAVWETRGTVKKQAACQGPVCTQMINAAFKEEVDELKALKQSVDEQHIEQDVDVKETQEVDNMEEKALEKKIEALSQGIEVLLKEREERILKEKAELAAKEEADRIEALKEEITKDLVTKEDFKELLDQMVASMRGDKEHVKQSSVEHEEKEEEEKAVAESIVGRIIKEPVAHKGGKTVQALSSEELVAMM